MGFLGVTLLLGTISVTRFIPFPRSPVVIASRDPITLPVTRTAAMVMEAETVPPMRPKPAVCAAVISSLLLELSVV